MPTYEYRCKDCDHQFEIVQSFTDDSLSECPECGGSLKKVFGNVGITFKGGGFYKTDSRSGAGSGTKSSDSASSSKDSTGSSSNGSSSADSAKSTSNGDSSKTPATAKAD